MAKKKGIIIIGIILLVMFLLIFLAWIINYRTYNKYYNNVCNREEVNITKMYPSKFYGTIELMAKKCKSTGGCFNSCGGECDPTPKFGVLSILNLLPRTCNLLCGIECACPYGTSFNNERGCIKW